MFRQLSEWLLQRGDSPASTRSEHESMIVVTERVFDVAPELLDELRQHRESSGWQDQITREHDAFLLDGGLGPPTYLSSDGRIVWHDDIWDVNATQRMIFSAILAGAKKTGIARLLDLLPKRSADASTCLECSGTGRFDAYGQLKDMHGAPVSLVCPTCAGLGWTSSSIDLAVLRNAEAG